MQILERAFRVYAGPDELESSIAFYEALQNRACERRVVIAETGVTAAKVGGFLILSGPENRLAAVRQVSALFYVDDLDALTAWLRANGATVLHEPRAVTGGRNLTACHPDGLVAEYFEAKR